MGGYTYICLGLTIDKVVLVGQFCSLHTLATATGAQQHYSGSVRSQASLTGT